MVGVGVGVVQYVHGKTRLSFPSEDFYQASTFYRDEHAGTGDPLPKSRAGLGRSHRLGAGAGAFENKIGHVNAAHFSSRANEGFLRRAGAQSPALAGSSPLKNSSNSIR